MKFTLLKRCLSYTNLLVFLLQLPHLLSASSNLIIDGDFSMVNLSGLTYRYFPESIPGWNCTTKCEVNSCGPMNSYWQSLGSYNANCSGNVLDLISDNPENVSQELNLKFGKYLLSITYYYPRVNAKTKTFLVFFNE